MSKCPFAKEAAAIAAESSRQAVIPLTALGFWLSDLHTVYIAIDLGSPRTAGSPEGEVLRKTLRSIAWWAAALLGCLGVEDPAKEFVAEYERAAVKHPGMTLECGGHTDETRYYALVEEVGEVASSLTYDNDCVTGHGANLIAEVTQVGALALAWATRYVNQ